MGRQYNYFISPKEEIDFAKSLLENGFLILAPQKVKNNENRETWEWKVFQLSDCLRQNGKEISMPWRNYIYKEDWGKLKNNHESFVEFLKGCPVIEHCHCTINEENKKLSSGRFWIDTYYREEMESFDVIYKAFQKLVRMMKKKIIYKSYEYKFKDGTKMHWPSSQQAVDLIESGYKVGL